MPKAGTSKLTALKRGVHGGLDSDIRGGADGDAPPRRARAEKPGRSAAGIKMLGLSGGDAMDDDMDGDGLAALAEAARVDDAPGLLPARVSSRILAAAREQKVDNDVAEDAAEQDAVDGMKKRVRFGGAAARRKGAGAAAAAAAISLRSRRPGEDSDDDDDDADDMVEFTAEDDVQQLGEYVDARMDEYSMTAEEADILARFMPNANTERKSLADMIMEKISEQAGGAAGGSAALTVVDGAEDADEDAHTPAHTFAGAMSRPALDPKVVEVYTEVGRYFAHYKTGKIPKVFKVIPALANWEEVLFLTNPETWTPHATYAATRIFASNLNPAKAQRFFNTILLPKCRDDIYANKKLNFHYYVSLKKATYKSAAFYKGIILPLATARDCTLREALIFGSIIAKQSLPQLHSAAALIKLAQASYNGAISVFLKILLNKKYTLPYMAVDIVADHFAKFRSVAGPLPVIWHQSLLAFAQRYKADLTVAQKEMMKELMHMHPHRVITGEVRRELFSVGCRDAPAVPGAAAADADASTQQPAAVTVASVPRRAPKRAGGDDMEY